MAKAAEIEKLKFLLDKPENKPLKQLLEKLSAENDDLQKEVDEMIPPDEFEEAKKHADGRAELIIEIFSFLHEVEIGHYDAHVYASEKRNLRKWAESLDVGVEP